MIAAGFGCRSGVDEASLRAALTATGFGAVDALATLTTKAPQLAPLANALGLPLIILDPAAVNGVATLTHSAASLSAHGTGSVAEAVALLAAGPGARLLGPRAISPDRSATCAIATGVAA